MKWGIFPKSKACSVRDVNVEKCEDENVNGDYGKIGVCIYLYTCQLLVVCFI